MNSREATLQASRACARFVASGAYAGFAPIAPGTAGSVLALAVWWLVPERFPWPSWFLVLAGVFVAGVHTSAIAEREWGKDPPKVVIDEIAGCFVALLLLPKSLFTALLGFTLFRFFDIIKPFPVHRSQRLPGGWGIMADDLIAGTYANVVVRLILWLG